MGKSNGLNSNIDDDIWLWVVTIFELWHFQGYDIFWVLTFWEISNGLSSNIDDDIWLWVMTFSSLTWKIKMSALLIDLVYSNSLIDEG